MEQIIIQALYMRVSAGQMTIEDVPEPYKEPVLTLMGGE